MSDHDEIRWFIEPVENRADLHYWERRLTKMGVPYKVDLRKTGGRWGTEKWVLLVETNDWTEAVLGKQQSWIT